MLSYSEEVDKSAIARVFGAVIEKEMEIEYLRMGLARLEAFEPFQTFNFLDTKEIGVLEPSDLENLVTARRAFVTEKECIYLTRLNATKRHVMSWDAFLLTFLPRDDSYMR